MRKLTDPDRHPILESPEGFTNDERIRWLETHVAMLWDQVWWMSLPAAQKLEYEAQGFTNPIQKYYGWDIIEVFHGS